MSAKKTLLNAYRGIVQLPVQWGDMDIGHHVNNVVYLRYLETGRVAYLQEVGFPNMSTFEGIGPILAEIHVKYKLPVTFPDTLSVGTRVTKMDDYNLFMETVIVSEQWQKITTTAEARIVSYDYRTKQKAHTPPDLKKKIAEWEQLTI